MLIAALTVLSAAEASARPGHWVVSLQSSSYRVILPFSKLLLGSH